MKDSKPILVPVDFHAHSDAAFEQAERLAADSNESLVVLHVCNMPDMKWSTCAGMTHHEELKSKLDLFSSSFVPVERVFVVADPGPEICRVAEELDCSLIVMGMTNKLGPDEFLCGSVHDYVEKNASCPLAILRQRPDDSVVPQE